MLKKLAIVAVIVLVLFAAGVFFVISQIDKLTAKLIEEGGTYALEVPVTVDSADLSLTTGALDLEGLRIANPEGFGADDERFLSLADGGFTLDTDTIQQEVIRVPSITMDDIDVLLVKDADGANYRTILDSLKRFEDPEGDGGGEPAPADPAEPSQRVVIDEIVLTDIDVKIRYATGLPGAAGMASIDVPIDEIRLEGVGEDPDNPVDLNDAIAIVVKALFGAVIAEAGGVLPPDFAEDLSAGLAELASLGSLGIDMATELGEDAQRQLQEVGRQVEQQLGEVGGEVGRALEGAAGDLERGLGGLIPGGGDSDGG